MSRILLRHIPTGIKIPLCSIARGLTRFIISTKGAIFTKTYEYTYDQLLQQPDWVTEDWDYAARLSFNELQEMIKLLELHACDNKELIAKCRRMLSTECERIKQEPNYSKYVDGSEDI